LDGMRGTRTTSDTINAPINSVTYGVRA
jgi:hypothetical protein